MRQTKPRWYVVFPLSIGLALCATSGYTASLRSDAYQAYIRRDFDSALQLYHEAADYSGCGMVFLALNLPDEAIEYFRQGKDGSGMGLCYLKKKEYQSALDVFSGKRDDRGLGLTYLALREDKRAEEAFSRALQLDAEQEEAHFGLARVFRDKTPSDNPKALAAYLNVLRFSWDEARRSEAITWIGILSR